MAFVPIALQLLPMIPGRVESVVKIVQAIRQDPATPEEIKAQLDDVQARLRRTAQKAAAVQFRELQPVTPEGMPPAGWRAGPVSRARRRGTSSSRSTGVLVS